MRRALAVLLLVPGLLAVAPAAEAVPTCGGKKATLVYGDGNDSVSGTAGDDVIVLGAGDDVFGGDLGGDDLVCGGPGDDGFGIGGGRERVWGGAGDDSFMDLDSDRRAPDAFHGGSGTDRLFFTGSALRLRIPDGHEQGHERDAFNGVEQFVGTSGDDTVVGGAAAEEYVDLGGADRVDLGAGDDTVNVTGPATVDTGAGDDDVTVFYAGSPTVDLGPGDDHVQVTWSDPDLDGGTGTDGADFLFDNNGVTFDLAAGTAGVLDFVIPALGFENSGGSYGADVLYGTDGPNHLDGGVGQDTVDGRGGDDVCVAETVVNC